MKTIKERLQIKKNKTLRKRYSYLLGIFLGDGSLYTEPKYNVSRLRVSCDPKYPNIIQLITKSINTLLPKNKVGLTHYMNDLGKHSWTDVSCYSKQWIKLFPFVKFGAKSSYRIKLESWQKEIIKEYTKEFWKGLFHTDGCRTMNRKSVCYTFSQKSKDIFDLFVWSSKLLGVHANTFYKDNSAGYGNSYIYFGSIYRKDDVKFLDTFAGAKT